MTKNDKNKCEIWIESTVQSDKTRTLTIGSDWGTCTGFKKSDCKKLFYAISEAVRSIYPDAAINPWTDDVPGKPDFD